MTPRAQRAFAVRWQELTRWDPSSFHGLDWHWPDEVLKPIGSVMRLRKEKVDRQVFSFDDLQPITIHFDGSISKRVVEGREYTMNLWFARPGDIVVAKIDLKNGAVAIVPDGWDNAVVTGHFAVYEPDLTRIVPDYLHRVIQTSFFKKHLWRNKVGAEGRKEVKLDFFESERIPLPPLQMQQLIVDRWRAIRRHAASMRATAEEKLLQLESGFLTSLGLHRPKPTIRVRGLAVSWQDLSRWGVGYNRQAQTVMDAGSTAYPIIELGSLIRVIQYGTSTKANSNGLGTPILRMNNIVDGYIDVFKLKHVSLPPEERDRLLLQDGDILINRTNSKELVGKCAVFRETTEYVFASYLIRIQVDTERANPYFISYAINSYVGRQQINALSRQIIGQANINTGEIRSIRIPLPPIEIQDALVQQITEVRTEVVREKAAADKLEHEGRVEIEEMIVGTRATNPL